ncbi:MAG TPA: YfhO family protein [Planctomycetota bacterium]
MSVLEQQLGRRPQGPRWLVPEQPLVRVADNGALLPQLLKIYNEGLHAGELRLWNPHQFCGYPLTYDTMVHPFYPPHLVLHRLLSWEAAYGWTLLLHFFACGVAMFHLLRAFSRGAAAATFGGFVWMLFGYNALWFSSGILLGVSVFGPLALLAIHRGLDTRRLQFAGFAGAAFGIALLGSHPQFALLLFVFLLAWIARHPERPFALRFALAFSILSVGVGLAAVLTRLDSLENGWRNPAADVQFFYGDLRALPHLAGLVIGKILHPDEPAFAYEFAVHAGLAVTTLAVIGAVRGWKEPLTRFLAVAAAVALGVAFIAPLAKLYSLVPILNSSPASRCVFVAGFAIAALAARGFDALRDSTGRLPWILGGVFALVLVIRIGHLSDGATIETLAGMALATAAAALVKRPRLAGGIAFAALIVDLLPPFYFAHNWPADGTVLREMPPALVQARGPWRATGLVGITRSEPGAYDPRDIVEGDPLLAYFGVDNVAGFEAIIPSAYVRYARTAGGQLNPTGRSLTWVRFDSPLMDAAGLRYLFLPPNLDPGPRFQRLSTSERVSVYENPRAFPRAWVVGRAVVSDDLLKHDLRTTAVLEEGPLPPLDENANGIVQKLPDGAWLAETRGPSLLVVSETWDAGWEAERDGQPVPVLRANGAFRAVPLAGGRHRVEFFYRPAAVSKGLIGSALFLLLSLAWPLLTFWRRQNVSTPANIPATPER